MQLSTLVLGNMIHIIFLLLYYLNSFHSISNHEDGQKQPTKEVTNRSRLNRPAARLASQTMHKIAAEDIIKKSLHCCRSTSSSSDRIAARICSGDCIIVFVEFDVVATVAVAPDEASQIMLLKPLSYNVGRTSKMRTGGSCLVEARSSAALVQRAYENIRTIRPARNDSSVLTEGVVPLKRKLSRDVITAATCDERWSTIIETKMPMAVQVAWAISSM